MSEIQKEQFAKEELALSEEDLEQVVGAGDNSEDDLKVGSLDNPERSHPLGMGGY